MQNHVFTASASLSADISHPVSRHHAPFLDGPRESSAAMFAASFIEVLLVGDGVNDQNLLPKRRSCQTCRITITTLARTALRLQLISVSFQTHPDQVGLRSDAGPWRRVAEEKLDGGLRNLERVRDLFVREPFKDEETTCLSRGVSFDRRWLLFAFPLPLRWRLRQASPGARRKSSSSCFRRSNAD